MDDLSKESDQFNELRLKQLAGQLSTLEQVELDRMMHVRLQEAEEYLAPAVAKMRLEQLERQEQIKRYQIESEALAQLLSR